MTPHFTGHLDTRWISDGKERILLDYFSYAGSTSWIIPVIIVDDKTLGFVTDGGTIPRAFWAVVGHPFSDLFPAFIGHDHRYSYGGLSFNDTQDELYEACLACGASKIRAFTIYRACKSPTGRIMWEKAGEHRGDDSYHYTEIK